MWKRLGLSEEEWADCRRSALEMTLAGAPTSARQVAVEFALAREFEAMVEPVALSAPGARPSARAALLG